MPLKDLLVDLSNVAFTVTAYKPSLVYSYLAFKGCPFQSLPIKLCLVYSYLVSSHFKNLFNFSAAGVKCRMVTLKCLLILHHQLLMKRLNKTESGIFISCVLSLLPKNHFSELTLRFTRKNQSSRNSEF